MGHMAHLGGSNGLLFVNSRSGRGGARRTDTLVEEAGRRGVDVHLLRPNDDVQELARAAAHGPLGMAGGDGSLASIAEVAIERDVPFVCVPFGTRNHFARDIGLDRDDPVAALDAFESGRELRIDVGRVAGRVFLNNVSFGVYARLVHRREAHRRRRDAFARLRALWLSLQHRHPQPFVLDGERLTARIVLVANNAYEVNVLDLGARVRLDEGSLHAYVAEGWFPHTWAESVGERFRLEQSGTVHAAIDGEPARLSSPVELAVEPRALRILVP
jgi:diacylglycerol kinase family enzyme